MFANVRSSRGFTSIGAVAMVMAVWLMGAGMMVKVYKEGGASKAPSATGCELVCNGQIAVRAKS